MTPYGGRATPCQVRHAHILEKVKKPAHEGEEYDHEKYVSDNRREASFIMIIHYLPRNTRNDDYRQKAY